jgi:hypothetical protein
MVTREDKNRTAEIIRVAFSGNNNDNKSFSPKTKGNKKINQ